jgi:hypothetical protein
VIGSVGDRRGVTHAVVLAPDCDLAGCTVCNLRFWTVRLGTPSVFSLGRDQRMTDSEAPIDCMACLVGAPAYDEACNDGSPPTKEIA